MKSKIECSEEIDMHKDIEYNLRRGIHHREAEILYLKYINSKQDREIGRLMDDLNERELSITDLLLRIDNLKVTHHDDVGVLTERINELKFELNLRNVPALKESLKTGARLALAQEDEIDRLNARIDTILETTPDVQETVQGDQIDRITELKNLFEYLKAVLIIISEKEGSDRINPDDIDVEYIETACRYCFPVLFDPYALLGDDDLHKIELADSILHEFDIETMDDVDIDIKCIDRRWRHDEIL